MECTEDGFLRFKEGFDSAAYSMWFKSKHSLIKPELEEVNDWKKLHFQIILTRIKCIIWAKELGNI